MAKSTLQSLKKIPGVPGLYRHENGSYYGKKKLKGGTKKVYALVTTDGSNIVERKAAEKALAAWVATLEAPSPVDTSLTFAGLWKKFLAGKSGQAPKTLQKYEWVKQCVDVDFPSAWRMRVTEFKPSDLAEFFAARRGMKASAFNEMSMHIKNVFEVAVGDGVIATNPYQKVQKEIRRKKNTRKPDAVPTVEQCEQIVAHVRSQEFSESASKSADMLALMHSAALGQAELIALDWSDVRWSEERIIIWERKKTGEYFEVPFFPALKPFLIDLHERQGKPAAGKVVSILSPKQALYNACRKLGLLPYSPRDLRKARIVWMLQKNVPVESIAKWQGHKDNGILIRRTYAWVLTDADKAFEKEQLAKLV